MARPSLQDHALTACAGKARVELFVAAVGTLTAACFCVARYRHRCFHLQAQPLHEPEYLVKWSGRAHIHNEWLPESTLLGIARRKLLNFKKRHGDAPVSFAEEEWSLPERFVARRPSPSSPGWEVLVKWQGQVR
jgi:hypothetical protein